MVTHSLRDEGAEVVGLVVDDGPASAAMDVIAEVSDQRG